MSVTSAEQRAAAARPTTTATSILYAATLAAAGVTHVSPPSVFARKLTPDGVLYEVSFTIGNYGDGKKAEHAVIKSILQCMRDADTAISFPRAARLPSRAARASPTARSSTWCSRSA